MSLLRIIKSRQKLLIPFIIFLLALLACNMGGQDASSGNRIINLLPTLTPTGVANLPPEPEPGQTTNPALSPSDPTPALLPTPIGTSLSSEPKTDQIANPTLSPSESAPALLPTPIGGSASDNTSVPIQQTVVNEPAPTLTQTIAIPIGTLPASTQTSIPPLTPTPLPVTASPPEIAGWSYAGVRTYYSKSGRNLSMYGDVVNNTGTSQKLALLKANFYDDQGQLIDEASYMTVGYWSSRLIPAGERLPFKLMALSIENVADFEFSVEAQPIDQIAHQDLEILDVSENSRFGRPCLQGRLRNVGPPLQEVVIVGALYDGQDQMLQFGEYKQQVSGIDFAAKPLEFEICFNLNNPNLIARHELRAWGQ